jgi:hypothetical protein
MLKLFLLSQFLFVLFAPDVPSRLPLDDLAPANHTVSIEPGSRASDLAAFGLRVSLVFSPAVPLDNPPVIIPFGRCSLGGCGSCGSVDGDDCVAYPPDEEGTVYPGTCQVDPLTWDLACLTGYCSCVPTLP